MNILTAPEWKFGDRLTKALKVYGISQAELARRARLKTSTLSNLCTNRAVPSFGHLREIVRALPGIDATWLILGDEE